MVLRGFHDHHVHLLSAAARSLSTDVSRARTVAEVIARLRAAPGDGWLRGWGHDDAALAEDRHPTRAELDRASASRPIVLHDRTGHVCVVNSAARARLGGDVLPDDGVLVDARAVLARVPRATDEQLDAAVAKLPAELAAAGVTAVTDATVTNDLAAVRRLARLAADGHLVQRVGAMVGAQHVAAFADAGLGFGDRVGAVRLRHAKIEVTVQTDPEELRERIAACARLGWPVALHVTDLVEADVACAALAAAPAPPGTRHRVEHLSLSLPEHVRALAAARAIVVTNPGFLATRAHRYATRLSADERGWLYRMRSLLDAGVPMRAGSDAPVGPLAPLRAARAAVERGGREAVTLPRALALYRPAPWAAHIGDRVVLRGTRVVATYIGGRRVATTGEEIAA